MQESEPTRPPNARSIVFKRLGRQAARWPDLAIESIDVESNDLPDRERAFARALELATVARWRTLEAILSSCLDRSWGSLEPAVRGALMGGAAQILLMEGVPDHAAVDESVVWTKRVVRPNAGGLVNGVLRAVTRLRGEIVPRTEEDARTWWLHRDLMPLESGDALRLAQPVFPEDHTPRVALQASLGDELLRSWIGAVGWKTAVARANHCLARAPIVVYRADGSHAPWNGSHAELTKLLEDEPEARIQDPASAAAVECTRELEPRLIVDYCAGRGTKTKQLAQLHPQAEIFASDRDEDRRGYLARTFAGHDRVRVVEPGGYESMIGRVDLLLLDVPCSNTGVLPRRPQARYRFNEARTKSLNQLQKEIVEESSVLLAPGAHLLYATCSLEPAENERQARWIARRFDARLLRERLLEPRGLPGGAPGAYSDGGFHVLATRETVGREP